MPLFEINDTGLHRIAPTTFGETGLKERTDLQRLLRDEISIVAPDVLVIAEEFGEWTESRRRIDLLGVDKEANLVVIELKRTEDGGHMELQSIRYAAMVSTLTADRAVEIFSEYLESRGKGDDAKQLILDFLEWESLDDNDFAQDVRLVLVSADFSRELTTSVIWLNERGLDIRCVRIRPHNDDGRILIDVQQVLPLPETADYQVKVREKKQQERAARKGGADFTRYDIVVNGRMHPSQWKRNAILIVVKALCEKGVLLSEIRALFNQLGRGRAFFPIDGTIEDAAEFRRRGPSAAREQGRVWNEKRLHLSEGDLFAADGTTYALSNQWGTHWPEFMRVIQERFPQIGLEYSPTESDH